MMLQLKNILRRKYYRKALVKPGLTYFFWRYVVNLRRTLMAQSIQSTYPDIGPIVEKIADRGIAIGQSDQYLSQEGCATLAEVSRQMLELCQSTEIQEQISRGASSGNKDYLIHLFDREKPHSLDYPLYRLARDKKLLEIVTGYLGMWPRVYSIGAWLNFPTENEPKASQLWHRDPEDLKILKLFIYLVDVDNDNGPFCYIPHTHAFSSGAGKVPQNNHRKRTTDGEMRKVFDAEFWLACTGPAGTAILADTVGYHRGGRPVKGRRILVTFSYTSGTTLSKRLLNISGDPQGALKDSRTRALFPKVRLPFE